MEEHALQERGQEMGRMPDSVGTAPAPSQYLTLLTCQSGGRRLVVRAAANRKGARL